MTGETPVLRMYGLSLVGRASRLSYLLKDCFGISSLAMTRGLLRIYRYFLFI